MTPESIILLLCILLFVLCILCVYFFLLCRRYRAGWVLQQAEGKKALKQADDMAFKLDVFSQSAQFNVWDYDIATDSFHFISEHKVSYPEYRWKEYLALIHPDDQPASEVYLNDLLTNQVDNVRTVCRMHTVNQKDYSWVEVFCVISERDEHNNPQRITGMRWDITEQKRKDSLLLENEKATELALRKYKVYPWIYIRSTDALEIPNRDQSPFANLYSFSCFIQEMVHPDDREMYLEKYKKFISNSATEGGNDLEVRARIQLEKDGPLEWLDITGIPLERDKDGAILKVVGVGRFMTVDIERENQLKKMKEMLELSLEASGIVPWEVDLERNRVYSPSLLSYTPDGTLSIKDYVEDWVEPEYRELYLNTIHQILRGTRVEVDLKIRVRIFETKATEWVQITGKALNLEKKTRKFTGVFRIITKEVEWEKELIALREAAEESNQLKTAFLANMSHEIRTPLNAIVGFSALLATTDEKEEIEEYNRIIAVNNELLLQLISDILDIAKIESGHMEFFYTEVDLHQIFHYIYQMYETKMPVGVTLYNKAGSEPLMLSTERNRLIQVLVNFLNNAIKFTPVGSITMGYDLAGRFVRIYVRDSGRGIAKDSLEKVFERFVKLDSFAQGTGLGLSICQMIVKRLGGVIGVDSDEGHGSEFWFTLPLNPPVDRKR